jgi:ABC-type transporter Mla subunit MlaD
MDALNPTVATATDRLLDTLHQVSGMLAEAEALAHERVNQLAAHLNASELARVERLLHEATHELGNTLALTAQELAIVQQRASLRARHPMFSVAQCDAVLAQGWSLALGQELQRQLPGVGLRDIAMAVHRLQVDAAAVPPAVRGA